jgi:hypothetical protein
MAATVRLQCLSLEAARAVAAEADLPGQNHYARLDGPAVVLTYIDKRYPLDVAVWAFEHGYADDAAAAAVIGSL